VHSRRLAHDLRDAQSRIERGVGILEDHLHGELPGAALLARHRRHVLAAPAHDARGLRQDAGDDAAQGALAAARFTHQAHDLAFGHVEIDVGDRLHDGLVHAGAEGIGDPAREIDPLDEALGDAAEREQRGRHRLMNDSARRMLCAFRPHERLRRFATVGERQNSHESTLPIVRRRVTSPMRRARATRGQR
jgi:hypothetical protein